MFYKKQYLKTEFCLVDQDDLAPTGPDTRGYLASLVDPTRH
jgi:hypothetical protein